MLIIKKSSNGPTCLTQFPSRMLLSCLSFVALCCPPPELLLVHSGIVFVFVCCIGHVSPQCDPSHFQGVLELNVTNACDVYPPELRQVDPGSVLSAPRDSFPRPSVPQTPNAQALNHAGSVSPLSLDCFLCVCVLRSSPLRQPRSASNKSQVTNSTHLLPCILHSFLQ